VWYLAQPERLSATASQALDTAAATGVVWVPTICLIEIIYLVERNRVPKNTFDEVLNSIRAPGSGFLCAPLDLGVVTAVRSIAREAIPDMPDRVIAGTALSLDAPLISADQRIRTSGVVKVLW
jgi:PIN domain nuclease of toxin-antitoxin system